MALLVVDYCKYWKMLCTAILKTSLNPKNYVIGDSENLVITNINFSAYYYYYLYIKQRRTL